MRRVRLAIATTLAGFKFLPPKLCFFKGNFLRLRIRRKPQHGGCSEKGHRGRALQPRHPGIHCWRLHCVRVPRYCKLLTATQYVNLPEHVRRLAANMPFCTGKPCDHVSAIFFHNLMRCVHIDTWPKTARQSEHSHGCDHGRGQRPNTQRCASSRGCPRSYPSHLCYS